MTQFQILNPKDGADLIFVNKPAGYCAHSLDGRTPGLAEILQNCLISRGILQADRKVHVIHNLDKTTTGCLLFALNGFRAKEYSEYFTNHNNIKTRYLLLTAAKTEQHEFTIQSKIEMNGENAVTVFKKVKLNAFFQLWEAFPKTDKPHQVRIHAAQAGIPILGDRLHLADIEIPKYGKVSSSMPVFFERMGLLRDSELCGMLSSFDRRERLFNFLTKSDECLRLSHLDNPKFRIDLFGPILWVYWYDTNSPTPAELERFEFLEGLLKRKVIIRKMQNRGADPNEQITWMQAPPSHWVAQESAENYSAKFEFRSQQGLSPGLFMDQRKNRQWVFQNSKNKRVLNLFSYTCGFSLAAALGGAKEVVTVDLSKNFLEWGKKNFILNGLDPNQSNYLFFAQNVMNFLTSTIKKNKTYDLIICDPPSFSRDGKNVWKIEKDFPELLRLCMNVLANEGQLLFSTNFEEWNEKQLLDLTKKNLLQTKDKKNEFNATVAIPNSSVWDYELPNENKLMKCVLISKKGI